MRRRKCGFQLRTKWIRYIFIRWSQEYEWVHPDKGLVGQNNIVMTQQMSETHHHTTVSNWFPNDDEVGKVDQRHREAPDLFLCYKIRSRWSQANRSRRQYFQSKRNEHNRLRLPTNEPRGWFENMFFYICERGFSRYVLFTLHHLAVIKKYH